jgi:hypothetical protein
LVHELFGKPASTFPDHAPGARPELAKSFGGDRRVMKHWHKAAILLSAAWIVFLAIYAGVPAYHQFACTPSVETLADGTIVRHACLRSGVPWPFILTIAAYGAGGVVVIVALSWLCLGWPSDLVSGYFGKRHQNRR